MKRAFRSRLVRNSVWTLMGYGARLGIQAVAFVLLARYLGPAEYGAFSAVLALGMMISPFIDLGTYSIVVRDVAEGISTRKAVGDSLLVTVLASPVGLGAYALLAWITLPEVNPGDGLILAIGIFVGTKLFNLARSAFVAHEELWRTAVMEIVGSSLQVGFVVTLPLLHGGFRTWSVMYLINQLVVGIGSMLWAAMLWGLPQWNWSNLRRRITDGLHFSTAGAAVMMTNSLDKIMLPRLASLEAAGIYSAAFRMTAVSLTPLMSVLGALHARFFRAGSESGLPGSRAVAVRFLPWFVAYGLVVLVGAWFGAPWIESLFGSRYAGVTGAVRLLAISIAFQAPAYLFADALSGGGRQPYRSYAQLGALVLNGLLNLILIPKYGWWGAGVANIASQAAFLGFVVFSCYKKSGDRPKVASNA
jgi:O-antigen/teichoic acid export membrane protein